MGIYGVNLLMRRRSATLNVLPTNAEVTDPHPGGTSHSASTTARSIEITPRPMNASTPRTSIARATLSTRVERHSFDDNGSPLELNADAIRSHRQ